MEIVILLVFPDLLSEGDVIGGSHRAEGLHRGQLEMLDEISDGLGQDVVTPDSSAEHLKTKIGEVRNIQTTRGLPGILTAFGWWQRRRSREASCPE